MPPSVTAWPCSAYPAPPYGSGIGSRTAVRTPGCSSRYRRPTTGREGNLRRCRCHAHQPKACAWDAGGIFDAALRRAAVVVSRIGTGDDCRRRMRSAPTPSLHTGLPAWRAARPGSRGPTGCRGSDGASCATCASRLTCCCRSHGGKVDLLPTVRTCQASSVSAGQGHDHEIRCSGFGLRVKAIAGRMCVHATHG